MSKAAVQRNGMTARKKKTPKGKILARTRKSPAPKVEIRTPAQQARVTGQYVGQFLYYELGLAKVPQHQVKVAAQISRKLMQKRLTPRSAKAMAVRCSDVVPEAPVSNTVRLSGMPALD